MKRLSLITTPLVCAALLAPSVTAAKGTSHAYKVTTIVKSTDLVIVDAKGDGPSAGDVYTFTITVFDKTGTHRVGKGHGYCVLGSRNSSMCTSITGDGKGKIVLAWERDLNAKVDQLAIIGGTRRYRNIRGDATATQPDAADPFTHRLVLRGTY